MMASENRFIDKIKEHLKNRYRLVVLNEDTFSENLSVKLNLMNLYILFCSFILIFAFIVVALIIWTPLKQYVPGYGNIENSSIYRDLNNQLTQMEEIIEAQEVYNQSLRRMLTGNPQTEEELISSGDSLDTESIPLPAVEEEVAFRGDFEELEMEDHLMPKQMALSVSQTDAINAPLYFFTPVKGDISLH